MDFNEHSLKATLAGNKLGEPLYYLPVTESTNHDALRLAENGAAEGAMVIADAQTGGRGRLKRTWISPAGSNIYVSLVLRPDIEAVCAAPLTIMAGVAVAETLSSICQQRIQLKWPNDVLLNQRKVAGILTEMKTMGRKVQFVVLGIGINVNMSREAFEPPLDQIATSLFIEEGVTYSRCEITANLCRNIGEWYDTFLREGINPIRERWLSQTQLLDKTIETIWGDDRYRGRVTGMDETGALVMLTDEGEERRIIAGDTILMKD